MGIDRSKRFASWMVGMVLCAGGGVAQAATVSVSPALTTVGLGATFSVDLIGTGFPSDTLGGGVDVSWDASKLALVGGVTAMVIPATDPGVHIPNIVNMDGVWDNPDTSPFSSRGNVDADSGTLTGLSAGTFSASIPDPVTIATLQFDAIGPTTPPPDGTTAIITVEGTSWGSASGGGNAISVTYQPGQVSISAVPLPPAVFLFGSALAGLGFVGRRRSKQQTAQV